VRRLATLFFLCGAAFAFAQQPPAAPPPPPPPPPEGAPMTPALQRMIQGRGEIIRVVTGFSGLDGIVWRREDGVTFTDPRASEIVTWRPGSNALPRIRVVPGGGAGLALDAEGRLVIARHNALNVVRLEGQSSTTVLDRVNGAPLWGPLDLAIGADGTVFVVDVSQSGGRILRRDPSGDASVLVDNLPQPSGVAIATTGKTLYVSDASRAELWAYPLEGTRAGPGRRLAQIRPWKAGVAGRPGGLLVDAAGHIFLAGPGGIWVLDENGGRLGVIAMPERPAACAFGDPDGRSLFVTAESSIYKVRLKKM
jgi:gluconolactonase